MASVIVKTYQLSQFEIVLVSSPNIESMFSEFVTTSIGIFLNGNDTYRLTICKYWLTEREKFKK